MSSFTYSYRFDTNTEARKRLEHFGVGMERMERWNRKENEGNVLRIHPTPEWGSHSQWSVNAILLLGILHFTYNFHVKGKSVKLPWLFTSCIAQIKKGPHGPISVQTIEKWVLQLLNSYWVFVMSIKFVLRFAFFVFTSGDIPIGSLTQGGATISFPIVTGIQAWPKIMQNVKQTWFTLYKGKKSKIYPLTLGRTTENVEGQ